MILKRITFNRLLKKIQHIFRDTISENKLRRIEKNLFQIIKSLTEANFVCYQTNMQLIEEWKKKSQNLKAISELDLKLRKYGEMRVQRKNYINQLIHRIFNKSSIKNKKITIKEQSNDLVYTIGDMIDRIIIETIKIADYYMRLKYQKKGNKGLIFKISLAKKWREGVMVFLKEKLTDINNKKFYAIAPETRTYNIKGIR